VFRLFFIKPSSGCDLKTKSSYVLTIFNLVLGADKCRPGCLRAVKTLFHRSYCWSPTQGHAPFKWLQTPNAQKELPGKTRELITSSGFRVATAIIEKNQIPRWVLTEGHSRHLGRWLTHKNVHSRFTESYRNNSLITRKVWQKEDILTNLWIEIKVS